MLKADDMLWFKQQFSADITKAIAGTPLSVDLLTAIACQETGYLWSKLRRKGLPIADILRLCVGDVLDSPKRKAFPVNKAALLKVQDGALMFDIARKALEDMAIATGDKSYLAACKNPDKFCRGFGIFQRDLQFFKPDPHYFLTRQYEDFHQCLRHCVDLLKQLLSKAKLQHAAALTPMQSVLLAVAYNTGSANPAKGAQQGYFDGQRYYGEYIQDYLQLAASVPSAPGVVSAALALKPKAGHAIVSAPSQTTGTGQVYQVDVDSYLNLRVAPDRNSDVRKKLYDGQLVQAVNADLQHDFVEVEASVQGALYRGFVAHQYLKPVADRIVPQQPAAVLPKKGITAVYMPNPNRLAQSRAKPANAHSLLEAHQPGRTATDAAGLRQQLAQIIDYLAVDNSTHLRYQPTKQTFCNIYAHDYCFLAGVYLPRVWWTQSALVSLTKGQSVVPRYGVSIEEQNANALFRWLRDFGADFGWRQTGNITSLQQHANQGAVCLIIACHRHAGSSGHVAMVVPESSTQRAKRNNEGEVLLPLQSQAGRQNFRYSTGKGAWWLSDDFIDYGLWLHA